MRRGRSKHLETDFELLLGSDLGFRAISLISARRGDPVSFVGCSLSD